MNMKSFLTISQLSALCYISVLLFITPDLFGQENKGIVNIRPISPCRFESEYHRIKSIKSDPRVAYIETTPMIKIGGDFSFHELCLDIAQQTEDSQVIYDHKRGFFQIFYEDPSTSDSIAYFAGTDKSPGLMLYVTRYLDYWQTGVFVYRNHKWLNLTKHYLGRYKLRKKDFIIVPQYGRTARVLSYDGIRFHHKLWLTWDGTKFVVSYAKKMPGWRCPDSYINFEPSDRAQYCR